MEAIKLLRAYAEARAKEKEYQGKKLALLQEAKDSETIFWLCKGNMHPTEVMITNANHHDDVWIKRLDNGKCYVVYTNFLFATRIAAEDSRP